MDVIRFRIIEETIEKNRTWRERLFTLPWLPQKKTKIIINPVYKENQCIRLGNTWYLTRPQLDHLKRSGISMLNPSPSSVDRPIHCIKKIATPT